MSISYGPGGMRRLSRRQFVQRAGAVAEEARFIDMGGLGHYLLRGVEVWNRVAVTESRGILDRVRERR